MVDAWTTLEEALQICPWNHRARFLKASCAMNAENFELAKAEAEKIYNSLSREQVVAMNDSLLHLTITHASKMLGDMDNAIHYAAEAVHLFPQDAQAYMVYGELC